MTRVLVTGGTGFIGRPTVERLVADGHDVHVAARHPERGSSGVTTHAVDLLDPDVADDLCAGADATVLVHLAWYAAPGRFWHDAEQNLRWVEATLRVVRAFLAHGGQRVVVCGTAAERTGAGSVYASAKDATHTALVEAVPALGGRLVWARLHQPYGPDEHPSRLIPAAVAALRDGGTFAAATAGTQVRDFIHVADVAAAFACAVEGDAPAELAIGTGVGTSVRELLVRIARRLDADDRLQLGTGPLPDHEPEVLVADASALHTLGWEPTVALDDWLDLVTSGSAA